MVKRPVPLYDFEAFGASVKVAGKAVAAERRKDTAGRTGRKHRQIEQQSTKVFRLGQVVYVHTPDKSKGIAEATPFPENSSYAVL